MSKDDKLDEVKHLISLGKEKGFLTYDELNNALPADVLSSEQLDNLMVMFGEMEIAKRIEEGKREVTSIVFGMPMTVKQVLSRGELLTQDAIGVGDLVVAFEDELADQEGSDRDTSELKAKLLQMMSGIRSLYKELSLAR